MSNRSEIKLISSNLLLLNRLQLWLHTFYLWTKETAQFLPVIVVSFTLMIFLSNEIWIFLQSIIITKHTYFYIYSKAPTFNYPEMRQINVNMILLVVCVILRNQIEITDSLVCWQQQTTEAVGYDRKRLLTQTLSLNRNHFSQKLFFYFLIICYIFSVSSELFLSLDSKAAARHSPLFIYFSFYSFH